MVRISKAKQKQRVIASTPRARGRLQNIAKSKLLQQKFQSIEERSRQQVLAAQESRLEAARVRQDRINRLQTARSEIAAQQQAQATLEQRQANAQVAREARSQAAAQRQQAQANRQVGAGTARAARGARRDFKSSSNVKGVGYDPLTQICVVLFNSGVLYAYYDVPKAVFERVNRGQEWARTSGKNRWNKWWRGKIPSYGAAVYWLLVKGGYAYKKITASALMQEERDASKFAKERQSVQSLRERNAMIRLANKLSGTTEVPFTNTSYRNPRGRPT